MNDAVDRWPELAVRWSRIGPPLRPSRPDIAHLEALVADWHGPEVSVPALLLGVTPQIARIRLPRGTPLLAVDRSVNMVQAVWPGNLPGHRSVVVAEWRDLPLSESSVGLTLGDGILTVLGSIAEAARLCRSLARVMAVGGRLAMRLFIRPDVYESVDAVVTALHAGEVGSFHAFKWRLAMALQSDAAVGVSVRRVWKAWVALKLDAPTLANRTGWPEPEIRTIEAFRESDSRLMFPSLSETRALLAPHFKELDLWFPDYELGERCPTMVLVRRRK